MSKEHLEYLQDAKSYGNYGPTPEEVKPGDMYVERILSGNRFYVVTSVQFMTSRNENLDRIVSVLVFENNEYIEHARFWISDLRTKMRA